MRDQKSFASLTSGLLARKGQAKPAMRPQGFGTTMGYPDDLGWNDMGHDVPRVAGVRLPSDLSGPQSALPASAAVPPVVEQQDKIAREFADPVEPLAVEPPAVDPVAIEQQPVAALAPAAKVSKPAPGRVGTRPRAETALAVRAEVAAVLRCAPGSGRKAAFTLRLDETRHLRLRLACAVEHRSAQQIVTTALDKFLATLPDVERLAASLPAVSGEQRD